MLHAVELQRLQTAITELEAANAVLQEAKKAAAESSLALGSRAAKAEAQVAVLTRQASEDKECADAQREAHLAEISSLKTAVLQVPFSEKLLKITCNVFQMPGSYKHFCVCVANT